MRFALDTEPQLKHLSTVVWECPNCHQHTIRYDFDKKLFVCWNCVIRFSWDEGRKIIDGFGHSAMQSLGDGHDC